MITVALPSVIQTFHRALNEVLAPFLSTGNPAVLMYEPVHFYKCDLFYSNQLFTGEPHLQPFICFTGTRAGARRTLKVEDPKQHRSFAYEVRQDVYRTVYVGMGDGLIFAPPPYNDPPSNRQATMEDAEIIWSQLLMVLEHQHANFSARGIYTPRIPAVPEQVPHHDYLLLRGELTTQIRFTLTRGN